MKAAGDDGPDLAERAVVTVFLRHEEKLLLVRRSGAVGTYRGRWSAISGYLEASPLDQAMTEIREETGLPEEHVRLAAAGTPVFVVDTELGVRWTVHPFLFDIDDPTAIRLDWENVEQRWIGADELHDFDTVPALADAYEHCRQAIPGD